MRVKTTRLVLACLLTLVVGACSSDDDSSDTGAGVTTSITSEPGTSEPAGKVTLEDEGSEPRQALVLKVAPGTTMKVALVARQGMDMKLGEESMPNVRVPATRMVMEQQVDTVDPDGTIHYRMTVTEATAVPTPGVSQDVIDQTQAIIGQLQGASGTGTVDSHGANPTMSFDTSSISDPTLKSTIDSTTAQLGNLSAPFPTEPVGIGARWTATNSSVLSGFTLDTRTTYTLRERQGDTYRLDVEQDANAPPGPVDIPNVPASAQATVEMLTMRSSGHVTGDLTKPLPIESANVGEGDAVLTLLRGAEQATLNQHMTIDFSIGPA